MMQKYIMECKNFDELNNVFQCENLKEELEQKDKQVQDVSFWNDKTKILKFISKEDKNLKIFLKNLIFY